MSFTLACLIFCWTAAVAFLYAGDLCVAFTFAFAGWVFLQLERKLREVMNRREPWEKDSWRN